MNKMNEEKNLETLEKAVGGAGTADMTGDERIRELIRLNLISARNEGMKPKSAIKFIRYGFPDVLTSEELKALVDEIWAGASSAE